MTPPTILQLEQGEVTEWLKVTVLKTVVPAMVPWVRIPPSPPGIMRHRFAVSHRTGQKAWFLLGLLFQMQKVSDRRVSPEKDSSRDSFDIRNEFIIVPMKRAARAIILNGDNILVMRRNKYGTEYYTLVGGREDDGETLEQTLVREIKEEASLDVTKAKLVFIEKHPEPYSQQYIYLCEVAPFEVAAIQATSEEGQMNKHEANIHTLVWAKTDSFDRLPFRTPQLQQAICDALKNGFPNEAIVLNDEITKPKPNHWLNVIFGRR